MLINRTLKVIMAGVSILLAVGLLQSNARADEEKSKGAHSCCGAADPGALVLSPEQFFGQAAVSYKAAKEIPEICCKLFCYCGCDQESGHTSLLECFISDHSVECSVCQEEAIQALRLKKEGKSLGEIQQWVDEHYQPDYDKMFKAPSKALQEYRRKRLWKPVKDK